MRSLLRWLAKRKELISILSRSDTHSVVALYRERPERAGNLLRALRDRVFELSRSKPQRFRVELAHVLPGRLRFRVVHAGEDDVRRLAAFVATRPGVARAVATESTGSILVLFDVAVTSPQELLVAMRGSSPAEWPAVAPIAARHREAARTAFNTGVLAAAAAGVVPLPITNTLVAATALPVARRAGAALRAKRVSVDLLDVVAVTISLATGQPTTAALITWLLGIGDLVLARTADSARNALAKLAHVEVVDAWVLRRGQFVRVPAKKLAPGDRIRVHAGEQVPADGVVVAGAASVDEKALTGESLPRTKRPGARVLAATVLRAGQIDVDVTRAGDNTAAARIVHLLQGADAKPMTLQREAERIADRVVLPTIGVAAAAGALSGDVARTTSVLITDFGTGIRIATPTAALAAMTAAAREGILVKGGQYLERLAKTDVIVFDKTGTLTDGEPRIVDVVSTGTLGTRALALAAAAEHTQSHPLARAVRRHARRVLKRALESEVVSSHYEIGDGVVARIGRRDVLVGSERLLAKHRIEVDGARRAASIYVAVDGRLELVMSYADVVRHDTRAIVAALRAGGRRELVLMSGDVELAVGSIAEQLGIGRHHARMMPEEKAAAVRALQRRGRVVAMVGDGINDAPALAVADIGISLHGATDVALETADVVLVEGGLSKLPRAFEHADAAMRAVRRGLAVVLVPNAAAIVLGAVGLLGPEIATVVNNGSTILAAIAALAPLW